MQKKRVASDKENAEEVALRYELIIDIQKEISEFGVSNKLNDYIGVQKRVLFKLEDEKFFEQVTNRASGIVIGITRKGIKETLGSGKRFQTLPRAIKMLKIATIHSLPAIIQNAEIPVKCSDNLHYDAAQFLYFETHISLNGVPCKITFDVKKTSAKNHFWIHYVNIKKENSELLTSTKNVEDQ